MSLLLLVAAVAGGLYWIFQPRASAVPIVAIAAADSSAESGRHARDLLAQLGAEVIKVESAMRPDAFRKPHPVYGRMGPAEAELAAEVASDHWRLTAYVTNPLDDNGDTFAYGNPFNFADNPQTPDIIEAVRQATPQRPRTFGLRLAAAF